MITSARFVLARLLFAIFSAIALVVVTQAVVAAPRADTFIRVLPATGNYVVGQIVSLEVQIESVTNLYGADVQLTFDPARFQVQDADPLKPGVQITPRNDLLSPDFIVVNRADNLSGTVHYAVTQVNPSPAVTGTGVLFAVALQAAGSGTGTIAYASHLLSTRSGISIPATAIGANYTITSSIGGYTLYLPLIRNNN